MTPDQITILASLLSILKIMSSWPFGILILMVVIGPWVLSLILAYSHKKRFEAVVRMYENNVDLVCKYEDVAKDMKEVVIMNTQTITRLVDRIDAGGR